MKFEKLIKTYILEYLIEHQLINENVQLADKVYFNTGRLSDEDKKNILDITGGDNYTKLISDFMFKSKYGMSNYPQIIKRLKLLYDDVLSYNKNVYPIVGYDVYNLKNISETMIALESRHEIINMLKKLPSVLIRNLKNDIRKERSWDELKKYSEDMEYFMGLYSLLSNRDEDIRTKILMKMFKSDTTLDKLIDFTDDKENLIGGIELTKNDIEELSKTEDFEIIYEQNNVMIIRVDSAHGIKAIGCNSLWCFTYGTAFQVAQTTWNNYSTNDIVYIFVDFNKQSDSRDFMYLLIAPLINDNGRLIKFNNEDNDDSPLYDMTNENYENPYGVLKQLFGKSYKNIIRKYLTFEFN